MDLRWDDTIAALASPPGPGIRGILRLTGPAIVAVLRDLFRTDADWSASQQPGRYDGQLHWPDCRAAIPCALQLWPTSRSYTGQPLAELHLIGSPPLLEAALAELFRRGARPARPGEFTLRAFLAGKLDLLQAEAVLGVIDAHDHAELKTALEQLAGGISHQLAALRSDLLNLLADLEAGLDFVDEHLEFISGQELRTRVAAARETIVSLHGQAAGRMHSGDVPRVVLAGLPNAGKSTLFNALVGRDQALVSPVAGTTRDYLIASVNWDGQTLELVDTAGVHDFTSDIDAAAQEFGHEQRRRADLAIWCTPADLSPTERQQDDDAFAAANTTAKHLVRIGTKADIAALQQFGKSDATGLLHVCVGAAKVEGLDALRELVLQSLSTERAGARQWLGATAARCEDSLRAAADALSHAEQLVKERDPGMAIPGLPGGDELIAVEIREALEHLGAIVGAVYTNDLLDRIFSRFCIGK